MDFKRLTRPYWLQLIKDSANLSKPDFLAKAHPLQKGPAVYTPDRAPTGPVALVEAPAAAAAAGAGAGAGTGATADVLRACQMISDKYGTDHARKQFGDITPEHKGFWKRHRCTTSPSHRSGWHV